MNKILIRCDGKDVVLYIEKTIGEVAIFISDVIEEGVNFIGIIDDVTKERIFINPKKVTLIKEVTDDESIIPLENSAWINKLATEVIKRINENNKNQEIIFNISGKEIGRVTVDKLKDMKVNQVLGN